MGKLAYLARPIDHANGIPEAYFGALELLAAKKYVVYQPATAWRVGVDYDSDTALAVHETNEYARSKADLLVALVSADVFTIGVPAEIAMSIAEGQNVLIVPYKVGQTTQIKGWSGDVVKETVEEGRDLTSLVVKAWDQQLRASKRGGVIGIDEMHRTLDQWEPDEDLW